MAFIYFTYLICSLVFFLHLFIILCFVHHSLWLRAMFSEWKPKFAHYFERKCRTLSQISFSNNFKRPLSFVCAQNHMFLIGANKFMIFIIWPFSLASLLSWRWISISIQFARPRIFFFLSLLKTWNHSHYQSNFITFSISHVLKKKRDSNFHHTKSIVCTVLIEILLIWVCTAELFFFSFTHTIFFFFLV